MHYLLAFVGALLGSGLGINGGFLIGAAVGLLGGLLWKQHQALKNLEARLDALAGGEPAEAPTTGREPVPAASSQASPSAIAAPEPAADQLGTSEPGGAANASQRPPGQQLPPPAASGPRPPSALVQRLGALVEGIKRFLTTGNPVVRIGAVVLFIGLAYLMRYAYEHSLVPLELRLAGAALLGVGLLAIGWRLRGRTDTYGLILQGVGLAILYLTVFASSRLYELLPMSAAFLMLVVLVAGASVLAVLQRSQALAIFSMSGGFLAPVLTSTGEGSHVALFSYYALLNGGILVMAWFRQWRWLNWTGFVFTFLIGASWGIEYYRPEHYASTQPFLILFFFFYLAVSVLFARHRDVKLKGLVDGTLVFGTPVIAFTLQAALVQDMPFGLAFSALGAAIVYTLLVVWLRRSGHGAALLDRSFLALAVVFMTLAVPFAFDNQRFTAATWALEGAGIFWVGVRQGQRLPRAFGLLLQLGAGVVFAAQIGRPAAEVLFLNSAYLGCAFLGLAGVFTAFVIGRHADALTRIERALGYGLLAWGVFWWLAGGFRELSLSTPGEERFVATNTGEHLFLVYAALSAFLLTFFARARDWSQGMGPGFLILPLAALVLAAVDISWSRGTLFGDFGWLAWPLVFGFLLWHLRAVDAAPAEDQPARIATRLAVLWHAGLWWFATLFLGWNLAAVVDEFLPASVWTYVLWGAVPLGVMALLLRFEGVQRWPFVAEPGAYFGWGWLVGYVYLLSWLLSTSIVPGDPAPIPYLVVFNPLELVQAAVLLLGAWQVKRHPELGQTLQGGAAALGLIAFAWLNSVAARAVHFYGGVDYPVDRLLTSGAFLTTATILWTSLALVLMGYATRRAVRGYWVVGASLLGAVLVKLFFVDMPNLDLVGRIISFISVGVLMLIIGYFAPIPPRAEHKDDMEPVR